MLENNCVSERQKTIVRAIRGQSEADVTFIQPERLQLYQQLIFSGQSELLQNAFPVVFEILSATAWEHLIKNYLKNASCQTPIYYKIPEDFVHYLQATRVLPEDLIELAHYEWLEVSIDLMAVQVESKVSTTCLNQKDQAVVNPSLVLSEYQYPVYRMDALHYPVQKQRTYLAVYRQDSFEVKFEALSLLSARVLYLLQVATQRGSALALSELIQQMDQECQRETAADLFELIEDWVIKQIIVEI